jgi:hypothetical protein
LIPFAKVSSSDTFPLERSDEETPGLLDAPPIVAKTGTLWIRYQSGVRAHLHGAHVSEDLNDPDGELAAFYRMTFECGLPDGSVARVYHSEGIDPPILARFALRFDGRCEPAWRMLGESAPLDRTQSIIKRIALGILPAEVLEPSDESGEANEERLAGLLRDYGLREECVQLVADQAKPSTSVYDVASEFLVAWEQYRTGNSFDAAVKLARLHLDAGHDMAYALRWWRRAAEGDTARLAELERIMQTHDVNWSASLGLSALRRLDRLR